MSSRPIVYGARHYFPGARVSHSHLYRIRQDGSGREQLTIGKSDDTLPVWSPDGRWIAFSRQWQNQAHPNAICLIRADGGPVRTLFSVGNLWIFWAEWLSRTHLIAFCLRSTEQDERWVAFVVPIATGKPERMIYHTWRHALSPDKSHMTAWSSSDNPLFVVRLRDGLKVPFPPEVRYECLWLDNQQFVALGGSWDKPSLQFCSITGKLTRTLPIQLTPEAKAWVGEHSPSFIDAFPGRRDCILVGWQWGGSQDGRWAGTCRVDLKTGKATIWAETNTIVASPNHRFFLNTRARDLIEIPGFKDAQRPVGEWGSPLLVGRVAEPQRQTPLVSGRVFVEGFDWR